MTQQLNLKIQAQSTEQSTIMETPVNQRIHSNFQISNKQRANKIASSQVSKMLIKNILKKPQETKKQIVLQQQLPQKQYIPLYSNLNVKQIAQSCNHRSLNLNDKFQMNGVDRFFKCLKSQTPKASNQLSNKFKKFIQNVTCQNQDDQKFYSDIKNQNEKIFEQSNQKNNLQSQQDFDFNNVKTTRLLKVTLIDQQNQTKNTFNVPPKVTSNESMQQIDIKQNNLDIIPVLDNKSLMDNLIDKYKKKLECQKYVKTQQLENFVHSKGPQNFTQTQVNFLMEYFTQNAQDRDLKQLMSILQENKFFKKLPIPIQTKVARDSKFLTFKKDEFVYKEGDIGFIILDGSVNVLKNNIYDPIQPQGKVQEQLYDGMYFGESDEAATNQKNLNMILSMQTSKFVPLHQIDEIQNQVYKHQIIKNKYYQQQNYVENLQKKVNLEVNNEELNQKIKEALKKLNVLNQELEYLKIHRSQSVQCIEDVILLEINNTILGETLKQGQHTNIDQVLQCLKQIQNFALMENTDLTQLANIMTQQQFNSNEIIISENDHPKQFYIRKVTLCKEYLVKRKPLRHTSSKKRIPQVYTGDVNSKCYNFQTISQKDDNLIYRYMINLKDLGVGQHFMGRSLLAKLNDFDYDYDYTSVEASKVTAVVGSSHAILLTLDAFQMQFLPNNIKKILLDEVKESKQFDDFNIDLKVKQFKNLDKYKLGLFKTEFDLIDKKKQALIL